MPKKIQLFSEYTTCNRVSKEYELELPDGEILKVNKWWIESDHETDNDYEIVNKELYDKQTEELQDEILDFISELQ